MGTPVPAMAGDGTLALGSGCCMVEQDHVGEDGGKIHVPDSEGFGLPAASEASSTSDGSKKHKASSSNAHQKAPAEKRKKSSALHVHFARSPLLTTVIVSPRTHHSGAIHLRSPSVIRDGPSSRTLDRSLYAGSSAALINQELQQPMEVPLGFHLDPIVDEQSYESQDGGQTVLGEPHVGQEVGSSVGSRGKAALAVVKSSFLAKRKGTGSNALKPPTEKRRKSPKPRMQVLMSPQLKRIMLSPRIGSHASKQIRSASVRGTGLSSDDTVISSSSDSPDDTAMDIVPAGLQRRWQKKYDATTKF